MTHILAYLQETSQMSRELEARIDRLCDQIDKLCAENANLRVERNAILEKYNSLVRAVKLQAQRSTDIHACNGHCAQRQ
jgi:regulator of replication initiation timing